jgi:hypothetical protein
MTNMSPKAVKEEIVKLTGKYDELEKALFLIEEGIDSGYDVSLEVYTDSRIDDHKHTVVASFDTEQEAIAKAVRLTKQIEEYDLTVEISNC